MAFDFKREFRELYQPKASPSLVEVPAMSFVAMAGTGDPNEEGGSYQRALELLYAFSYSIKMAKRGEWQPEGYFDFVVPPLEGLWWAGAGAFDGASIVDKSALSWVSLIRQPDFVTSEVFARTCEGLAVKKPSIGDALARGELRLVRFAEGPCAQVMHRGSYDQESSTISMLSSFIAGRGLTTDITDGGESPEGHEASCAFDPRGVLDALDVGGGIPKLRMHHEIYLGDPRRSRPENLRTVIRHPVRR